MGIAHREIDPAPAPSPAEPDRPLRDWLSLAARTRAVAAQASAQAVRPFCAPSGVREDEDARRNNDDEHASPRAGDAARYVGIAVHDALERWDFGSAEGLWLELEAAILRACPDETENVDAVRDDARAVVQRFLASELPAHLASAQVLGRELPLLYRDDEGQTWSASIDLLYRDPDGRLVIADYKTDRQPDPDAHREQLEHYARGIQLAFPDEAPPAQELLFLRTGARARLG